MKNLLVSSQNNYIKVDAKTNNSTAELVIDKETQDYLSKNSDASIEIRSIRLAKDVFKNIFPNFCVFTIPKSGFKTEFELPEREQSRKRKDNPIDLTKCLKKKSK